MAKTEVIPVKEVQEHKTKVSTLMETMSAIKVSSQEELTAVAGHIEQVKQAKKVVTEARDKYIAPAKEIIQLAKDMFDPIANMCDEVEKLLKGKAQVFMEAEEKKAEDEKKKILEDGRTKVETKVEKLGEVQEAPKSVKTASGASLGMKKVKEVVIVDATLIPDEYYKPRELDMVKIKKVATAGIAIPGVKVEEKSQMAMR